MPCSVLRSLRFVPVLGLALLGVSPAPADEKPAAGSPPVSYARDVLPILAKNCFSCHGSDAEHREAGLRLDVLEGSLAQLPSGERAVVAGKPEQSELLARVTSTDADVRMPPAKHGKALSSEQVEILRRWIAQGGSYAKHWAFVAPQAEPLPAVRNTAWSLNELDRFILAKLEAENLAPNDDADRYVLARRLSIDLRGLPPTIAEVDKFLADKSPDAYTKYVERLLADPAFGERWARPWLDLARYADSRGYGSDPLRLNIWPYRNWVIDALNRDLTYDRFTIEQIAGDLLPNPTPEQIIATAFHRNTMTNTEGGTDDEEFRIAAVNDRTHVTMQVWMGLTMGCAKCHNHKYDPISQKEYYRAFAIFNQTEDADRGDESPNLPVPDAGEAKNALARADLQAKIEALKKKLLPVPVPVPAAPEPVKKPANGGLAAELLKDKDPKSKDSAKAAPAKLDPKEEEKIKAQIRTHEKEIAALQPVAVPIFRELPKEKQRPSFILIKGNFLTRGEPVVAGIPEAFHPIPKEPTPTRLTLARWLVARDNPLTARVAVNRLWAQLFGIGLVETEEDFGIQGALPSHPELLDWLAVRFMTGVDKPAGGALRAQPWSMKDLLRLIVHSRTYRQASRPSAAALARDPRNRLLSHAPRVRLEAEAIRDQALALSGLLSRKIGGPSVFPPQPAGMWQAAFNGERTWTTSTGEDKYRRGLYTFWRRTVPYPSMTTFDAPSREICAVRRIRTNTPLKALVTLNDPVYVEAAQAIARRIVREGGSSPEERARFALRLCTSRPPTEEHVAALLSLHAAELAHYRSDAKAAGELSGEAVAAAKPQAKNDTLSAAVAETAAWTVVANVLLNLDAVLTRG
ncbi:MAG: PSD1 and planctomycete cytochrome C domain-containing protein [Planctomycetia bacterium]|nr:PSD1 and planctomycete cytochrome C domain-containing protein [Planctomycetia bacterium]